MSTIDPTTKLNLDCWCSVLRFLDGRKDKARARQVCKIWQRAIDNGGALVWLNDARDRFNRDKFFFPQGHLLQSNSFQDLTTRANAAAAAAATTTSSSADTPQRDESAVSVKLVPAILQEANKSSPSYPELFRLCRLALINYAEKGPLPEGITPFPHLEDLLADPTLVTVHGLRDADEPETQTTHIAAILYLLKGLRAESSTIRDCAAAVFRNLMASLYNLCSDPDNENSDLYDLYRNHESEARDRGMPLTVMLGQLYLVSLKDAPQECQKILNVFPTNLLMLQHMMHANIPPSEGKTAIFNALAKNVVDVDPTFNWKSAVCGIAHRVFYKLDIEKICILLLMSSFGEENRNRNFHKRLQLSCQALRCLSQTDPDRFVDRGIDNPGFPPFQGLSNHLENPKYGYVLNSNTPQTSKLRTAAVLYLIQGFELKSPTIRSIALTFLKRVARDYHDAGQHSLQKDVYKRALFEVCCGFYKSSHFSHDNAMARIRKILRNDEVLFNEFVKFLNS